jgi:arsenate reductase
LNKARGIDVADHTHGSGPTRVIFVCTHNSARSIMAEALLRAKGGSDYEVVSAGTEPGAVRPLTLRVLEEAGLSTTGLRSKSVTELMGQRFDYVITVCDSARQHCPVFPGEGERIHWGYDDPSAAEGDEAERLQAYWRTFTALSQRIDLFLTVQARPAASEPARAR